MLGLVYRSARAALSHGGSRALRAAVEPAAAASTPICRPRFRLSSTIADGTPATTTTTAWGESTTTAETETDLPVTHEGTAPTSTAEAEAAVDQTTAHEDTAPASTPDAAAAAADDIPPPAPVTDAAGSAPSPKTQDAAADPAAPRTVEIPQQLFIRRFFGHERSFYKTFGLSTNRIDHMHLANNIVQYLAGQDGLRPLRFDRVRWAEGHLVMDYWKRKQDWRVIPEPIHPPKPLVEGTRLPAIIRNVAAPAPAPTVRRVYMKTQDDLRKERLAARYAARVTSSSDGLTGAGWEEFEGGKDKS